MALLSISSLLPVMLGLIALRLQVMYKNQDYDVDFPSKAELTECEKVGLESLVGTEDMNLWENGIVFGTSGDVGGALGIGSANVADGKMFAVNLKLPSTSKDVKNLKIRTFSKADMGFPSDVKFLPHGMYLLNASKLIFVVNHSGGKTQTRIEIFKIKGNEFDTVNLEYVRSVRHDMFGNFKLNDVAALSDKEIYVTRWLAHSPSSDEVGFQAGPILERLKFVFFNFLQQDMFGTMPTDVLKCNINANPVECHIVASGFKGANGITIATDKSTLYVNDWPAKTMTAFAIDDQGELFDGIQVSLPYHCDNVDYDPDTGDLLVGCVFANYEITAAMQDPTALVHGAFLKYSNGRLTAQAFGNHASAGIRYGDIALVGRFTHPGLIACTKT